MTAPTRDALIAELASPDALLTAVRELRAKGYAAIDTRTPHEIEGLDGALSLHARRIPTWAFAGGLCAGATAYALEWWTAAIDFPLDVGARPLHSVPAFVPIAFESTILGAALATFVGLAFHARLLRLWEPLDEIDPLHAATVDGYFLVVDARDPRVDWDKTPEHLRSCGALRVLTVRDARMEDA